MLSEGHYLGDCMEYLSRLEDSCIDMALIDLPYGTTQNKWDSVIPLPPLWAELWRVCKQNAAVVLTATQPFSSSVVMSQADYFRYEWIWVKSKITGVLNAKRMPVRKHEQVLVFYREQPVYNAQGLIEKGTATKQGSCSTNYGKRNTTGYIQQYTNWPRDVLDIPSEGNTVHPTQKPVALFEYFIKTYTDVGGAILDCCSGSGTTAVASINTCRKYVCIERDKKYYDDAEHRIARALEHGQRNVEVNGRWSKE